MYRIEDKGNTEVNNKYIRDTEICENTVKLDFKEYRIQLVGYRQSSTYDTIDPNISVAMNSIHN